MPRQAAQLKVVPHKEALHLPMPLINPVSLFTVGAWEETFQWVDELAQKRRNRFYLENSIVIMLQDLYFSKVFGNAEFRGFPHALKQFSDFGTITEWTNKHDDRADEYNLLMKLFGDKVNARFYEWHGTLCFSMGGSVASDGDLRLKEPSDEKRPLRWEMEAMTFINFLRAVERSLIGIGDPVMCRARIDVEFPVIAPRCLLRVEAYMEHVSSLGFREMMAQMGHNNRSQDSSLSEVPEARMNCTLLVE